MIGTCKLSFLSLLLDYNLLLNIFRFKNLCVLFFQTELMLLYIPVESRSPYPEESFGLLPFSCSWTEYGCPSLTTQSVVYAIEYSKLLPLKEQTKKKSQTKLCSAVSTADFLKSWSAQIIMAEVIKGIISPLLVSMFHYISCPVISPILFPALVSEITLYYLS